MAPVEPGAPVAPGGPAVCGVLFFIDWSIAVIAPPRVVTRAMSCASLGIVGWETSNVSRR